MPRRLDWRALGWFTAGLVSIVLMRRDLLGYDAQLAPVIVPAALKQRIVEREFAVTVSGFRLARRFRIVDPSAPEKTERVLQPQGLWLAVPVEVDMLRRPGLVGARLRTRDGLLYAANGNRRPDLRGVNIGGQTLDPGQSVKGAYFFEVPPARLPGAHLQLFSGTYPPKLDAVIDIDLGIDEAALSRAVEELDLRP